MEGRIGDPIHAKYCVRPGVIDLDHLELVALVKVTRGSWMPHFRLITPSRGIGVRVPQWGYELGAGLSSPNNQHPVSFVRQDGSYIPVTAAWEGDYSGLVKRDLPALGEGIFSVRLQLQVNRARHPRPKPGAKADASSSGQVPRCQPHVSRQISSIT